MEEAAGVIRLPWRGWDLLFLSAFLVASLVVAQPVDSGRTYRQNDLVEVVTLDSTIHLDIRYATADNFMKRPMYTEARAFLQRPAAEALVRINRGLLRRGFGLLVFDAYRPWSVTKQFWDATPPEHHGFVADPAKGSKHNRGCAVDLTLYSRADGKEVRMPSPFDDFTDKASPKYRGGTAAERRMRDLLRHAMEKEGFTVDPGEWWHFDYRQWRHYRVMDVPFEELGGSMQNAKGKMQK